MTKMLILVFCVQLNKNGWKNLFLDSFSVIYLKEHVLRDWHALELFSHDHDLQQRDRARFIMASDWVDES